MNPHGGGPIDLELPWYAHHGNLVLLAHHLAENGASGQEVADAVEKPWKYQDEFFDQCQAAFDSETPEDRYRELYGHGSCVDDDDFEPDVDRDLIDEDR